jgi:DNA polymerase V
MDPIKSDCISEIYSFKNHRAQVLPFLVAKISAGFPSPADDYIDKKLDLNELLIKHPSATFFVRVSGDSMIDAGINSGDILIVDRALEPAENRIVIAALNGELTVKRMRKINGRIYLIPENAAYDPIEVIPEMQFEVWGVVSHVIHQV